MAKPTEDELVIVVSRKMIGQGTRKKPVRYSTVHNRYCTVVSSDKFGPIPFGLLKSRNSTICQLCFPHDVDDKDSHKVL